MTDKTLFDTFNARYLSFIEVSDSFINNVYFERLSSNSHSLLMGPRGCGKTTLLKMLTPPALMHWDNKHKTNLFNNLPFIGVYIPTDIQWKRQLEQLTLDFPESKFPAVISKATVNVNILVSLIKTFAFLKSFFEHEKKIDLSSVESELCKNLVDSWKLKKPIIPTFDGLEIHLISLIGAINGEIKKSLFLKKYEPELGDFFFLELIDIVRIGCTLFEKLFHFENKKKWALCFDELEISPDWLQQELLTFLRSRDQSIVFKLTTAPIVSIINRIKYKSNLIEASENNDFNAIKIWTSDQKQFKEWREFCTQLVRSKISRRLNKSLDPHDIFGNSFLERLIVEIYGKKFLSMDQDDFELNSPSYMIVKDLAKADKSFENFLVSKNISPSNPLPANSKQKDEVFRKIKQLAIYRFQFRKAGNSKRSRKVIPLYYGIHLIYDLCDGNPRILVGMIDELLNVAITKQNTYRELSINEQSRIITEISEKYIKIISAHPDANSIINERWVNIFDILNEIGTNFHHKQINEPFTMDPSGSFLIDEDINNKYIELLELALYLGAIVLLDPDNVMSENGIVGKRFRLSYTLSPYFGLLSREFKSVRLSSIISKAGEISKQSNLFKKNED